MDDHTHHNHGEHGDHGQHGEPAAHLPHSGLLVERKTEHKGRDILIRTRYEIEIDGKPFKGHIAVGEDGLLTTHAIPYVAFPSAMDLMKAIIDRNPGDM